MIHHGIVSSLQKFLLEFVLKSDADVDALLNYKLRCKFDLNLHILHIKHILHILYIYAVCQIGTRRQDSKGNPFDWQGFPSFYQILLWFLPFSCTKQAYEMLAKKEMAEDNWIIKLAETADEHLLERAPKDLCDGGRLGLRRTCLARTAPRLPARLSLQLAQHRLSVMLD
jgi:hypothetical protein